MAIDSVVVLAIGSDHCIFHVNRMATNNFYVRQVKSMVSTPISQPNGNRLAKVESEKKKEKNKLKKMSWQLSV